MDDTISNVYNELLDRGISVTDLYIYDCLVNDGCVGHEEDIERLMTKIKNNYIQTFQEKRHFILVVVYETTTSFSLVYTLHLFWCSICLQKT